MSPRRRQLAPPRLVARIVQWPAESRRLAPAIAAGTVGSVWLIGAVDAATGATLTLGVFYLLPIALGTIAIGTRAGAALGVMSAVVWVLADALRGPPSAPLPVHFANGVFRGLIFLVVVALIAGLRVALEAARDSEQRSRQFLAFAAHQLRTPVAGMRSASDALLAQGSSPGQEQLLRHIAEESARAGRLVNALLRMARLDQGEHAQHTVCDPASVVEDEVTRLTRLVSSAGRPSRHRAIDAATRDPQPGCDA